MGGNGVWAEVRRLVHKGQEKGYDEVNDVHLGNTL